MGRELVGFTPPRIPVIPLPTPYSIVEEEQGPASGGYKYTHSPSNQPPTITAKPITNPPIHRNPLGSRMQRAALLITALIGIASAYPQAPSGGAGGAPGAKDPAMESAMSNTCQAMETFWSGMTPDCVNGVKALMRQPNTPIGTIKSQVAAYVGANCSSSTDALNKLEAAINNTIQVANDTVQKSSQIPAEGKALISQMMVGEWRLSF